MDERSQKILANGMAITLVILYLGLFVLAIWKYVTTADITNSTWEIILIVMIPASILWFSRKDESLLIPKMITVKAGQEYPTETDDQTKRNRKKLYLLDALGLATVFLILRIVDALFIQKGWDYVNFFPQLSETLNIITYQFLEFVLSVLVFYVIAFVWGEWKIKKYNRKIEELEDDYE